MLIFYVFFSESLLGKALDKKLSNQIDEQKKLHIQGNSSRKQFHKNIGAILKDLAKETDTNRAIACEFSNGTSNLVGLPFLYMSIAAEVMCPGLDPIIEKYQRINVSFMPNFLLELEEKGYLYIEDFQNLPSEYGLLPHLVKDKDIKSGLFYSIEGVEEAIGFIAVFTIRKSNKMINTPAVMAEMAKAAQRIGALINFSELNKIAKSLKQNKRKI